MKLKEVFHSKAEFFPLDQRWTGRGHRCVWAERCVKILNWHAFSWDIESSVCGINQSLLTCHWPYHTFMIPAWSPEALELGPAQNHAGLRGKRSPLYLIALHQCYFLVKKIQYLHTLKITSKLHSIGAKID